MGMCGSLYQFSDEVKRPDRFEVTVLAQHLNHFACVDSCELSEMHEGVVVCAFPRETQQVAVARLRDALKRFEFVSLFAIHAPTVAQYGARAQSGESLT